MLEGQKGTEELPNYADDGNSKNWRRRILRHNGVFTSQGIFRMDRVIKDDYRRIVAMTDFGWFFHPKLLGLDIYSQRVFKSTAGFDFIAAGIEDNPNNQGYTGYTAILEAPSLRKVNITLSGSHLVLEDGELQFQNPFALSYFDGSKYNYLSDPDDFYINNRSLKNPLDPEDYRYNPQFKVSKQYAGQRVEVVVFSEIPVDRDRLYRTGGVVIHRGSDRRPVLLDRTVEYTRKS